MTNTTIALIYGEIPFELTVTCDFAPFQAEGTLPDGRSVYFRVRHYGAQLGLGGDHHSAVEATAIGGTGRRLQLFVHDDRHPASGLGLGTCSVLLVAMFAQLGVPVRLIGLAE